jgi:ribosomal protein S18 acetylase RimI-like enzyme
MVDQRASLLGPIQIAQAQPADLPVILEILDEAARWLAERQIQQWSYPPPPSFANFMRGQIEQGDVYLARLAADESAVGTLRFAWQDADLWQDSAGLEAGYVHSLAIRPHLQGQQLGEILLDWAKAHVRRRNCRYLRLDCVATNQKLRRYYSRLGFRPCGEASAGDFTGALFELALKADD